MDAIKPLHATLYGAPDCRRYRRIKRRLNEAAAAVGVAVALEEVNDAAALARFNPVTLPRLYVEGQLVATRNAPSPAELRRILQAKSHA